MFKADHKKIHATARRSVGQAATELAVFGAVLIFLIGTIVRSAVGNSYTQNQNFKAMRMAMLASWQSSKTLNFVTGQGVNAPSPDTSHNNASILFVEDRLSPDFDKYGDLDRNPYMAQGSGSFTYALMYPLSQFSDVTMGLPVMDIYINGIHFPFTTEGYKQNIPLTRPLISQCQQYQAGSCEANQCYRNYREWAGAPGILAGGIVRESSFVTTTVAPITGNTAAQRTAQMESNACNIFTFLQQAQMFTSSTIHGSCGTTVATDTAQGAISASVTSPLQDSSQWTKFKSLYTANYYPNNVTPAQQVQEDAYLGAILNILQAEQHKYKLFYSMVANMAGTEASPFSLSNPPATCNAHPCKDAELSPDVPLLDYYGNPTTDGDGKSNNINGVMQYDLMRNADYTKAWQQFPATGCPGINCMRNYIAWQWSATAATTAQMIGLNVNNNQYPSYDVDGRLKEVTIYTISQNPSGTTLISYEDPQSGDIDSSWDANTCGPKPGLKTTSQIFTFTQDGTYLQINEGKLYNPETGSVVRSANKRNTVDLIQRTIQLSNNTHRFCSVNNAVLPCVGAYCPKSTCSTGKACTYGSTCADGTTCPISTNCATSQMTCPVNAVPNPVETCVAETKSNASPCFTASTIAETCYDTTLDVIFVRSRLQDTRGRFWMTNTSGQLQVH